MWECALAVCKELVTQCEEEIFDYKQLSSLLKRMSQFYDNIMKQIRPEPEYFRVAYYGRGFPAFLQNKVHVQLKYIHDSFKKSCDWSHILKGRHRSSCLQNSVLNSFNAFANIWTVVWNMSWSYHVWSAEQSSNPLEPSLHSWSDNPLAASSSVEGGKNHMVQNQERWWDGKHHATLLSELLLHKQWLMCWWIVMQEHPVFSHPQFGSLQVKWMSTLFFMVTIRNELMVHNTPWVERDFNITFPFDHSIWSFMFNGSDGFSTWRIIIYFGNHIWNTKFCCLWCFDELTTDSDAVMTFLHQHSWLMHALEDNVITTNEVHTSSAFVSDTWHLSEYTASCTCLTAGFTSVWIYVAVQISLTGTLFVHHATSKAFAVFLSTFLPVTGKMWCYPMCFISPLHTP